jgi:hypothetical protein
MIGRYWTTGIKVTWGGLPKSQWCASLEFCDSGFCQDASTEGTLTLRYYVDDIVAGIKTLKGDAENMDIKLLDGLQLYVEGDGEGEYANRLPTDWRAQLAKVADACDLAFMYRVGLQAELAEARAGILDASQLPY